MLLKKEIEGGSLRRFFEDVRDLVVSLPLRLDVQESLYTRSFVWFIKNTSRAVWKSLYRPFLDGEHSHPGCPPTSNVVLRSQFPEAFGSGRVQKRKKEKKRTKHISSFHILNLLKVFHN